MTLLHKIRPGDPLKAVEVNDNFRTSLRDKSKSLENRDIVEGSLDTRHLSAQPHPFREPSHHFTSDRVPPGTVSPSTIYPLGGYGPSNITWLNAQFNLYNGGAFYMVGSARVVGHASNSGVAHLKIISAGSQIGYDIITTVSAGEVATIPIMWAGEWYDPSNSTSLPGTFSVEIQATSGGSPGSSEVMFSHCAVDMFVIHV